ncbi:uncharacterized protein LOC121403766 isoform X2 [Drosophila obscura]|uniref:uncharacterized protein LOC121403766 isoform X2 n=1 Tax=Drosophila obscura TaxID=7282 RepID=UPI001BB1DF62|nr:uncharacterized protein LOC121403766 isoform X2 [Drosophila obscura]
MALGSFRFFVSLQKLQRFSTGGKKVGGSGRKDDEDGTSNFDQRDVNIDDVGATNAKYMEHLFAKWLKDESSIHPSWQKYFREMVKENSEGQVPVKPDGDVIPGAVKDMERETTEPESAKQPYAKHLAFPNSTAKNSTSTKQQTGQPIASNPDNPIVPFMTEKDSTKNKLDAPTTMPMDYVDLFSKLEKSKAPRSVEVPGSQKNLDGDGPTPSTTPTAYFDTIDPQSDIVIGPTILSPFVETSSSKDDKTTPPKTTTRELLGKISKNVKEKAKKIMTKSQRLPKTLPNKSPKMLKTQKYENLIPSKPKKSKRKFKILKTQVADDKKDAGTQDKSLQNHSANNKNPILLYKVGSSGSVDYFRPIPDRRSLKNKTKDCAKEKSPWPGKKDLPKKYGTRLNKKKKNPEFPESNILNQNETMEMSTENDKFESSKSDKNATPMRVSPSTQVETTEPDSLDFQLPEPKDKSLKKQRKTVDAEKKGNFPKKAKTSISIHKSVYKMVDNDRPESDSSEKKSRGYKASHKRVFKQGPSVKYRQVAKKQNFRHKMNSKSESTRTQNPIRLTPLTPSETRETNSVDYHWPETDENTLVYWKKSKKNQPKSVETIKSIPTQKMETDSDSIKKRQAQDLENKSPEDNPKPERDIRPIRMSRSRRETDESTFKDKSEVRKGAQRDAKRKGAPEDYFGDDRTNPDE